MSCCADMDREYDKLESKLESAERAAGAAIDELRRWQYSDDVEQIRHSIDAAIRILQRG